MIVAGLCLDSFGLELKGNENEDNVPEFINCSRCDHRSDYSIDLGQNFLKVSIDSQIHRS